MLFQVQFSKHARQRMQERFISQSTICETINRPQKLEQSQKNRQIFIAKKIYYNEKLAKNHLLMVIYQIEVSVISVITIIDTSKINKYL